MFHDFFKVIISIGFMNVVITELFSLRQDTGLNDVQQVTDLFRQVVLREEGFAKGRKSGLSEGRKRGLSEGRKRGLS